MIIHIYLIDSIITEVFDLNGNEFLSALQVDEDEDVDDVNNTTHRNMNKQLNHTYTIDNYNHRGNILYFFMLSSIFILLFILYFVSILYIYYIYIYYVIIDKSPSSLSPTTSYISPFQQALTSIIPVTPLNRYTSTSSGRRYRSHRELKRHETSPSVLGLGGSSIMSTTSSKSSLSIRPYTSDTYDTHTSFTNPNNPHHETTTHHRNNSIFKSISKKNLHHSHQFSVSSPALLKNLFLESFNKFKNASNNNNEQNFNNSEIISTVNDDINNQQHLSTSTQSKSFYTIKTNPNNDSLRDIVLKQSEGYDRHTTR